MEPVACKYADLGCKQMLIFLVMPVSQKRMPVHAEPIVRESVDQILPKGTYYTAEGLSHKHDLAPVGIELYIPHWGHCVGAEIARKK